MGEKRSDTKEKILTSALKLFSKKGFKETTIKDIAKEVGITEGAIYRHFTSKEEIIRSLLESITEELKLKLETALHRGETDEEILESIVDTLVDYAFSNPESFRFLNLYHLLKEYGEVRNLPGELILKFLNGLYLKGKLRTYPEISLAVMTGSVERVFIFKERNFLDYDEETIKEELKKVIKSALLLER